MFRTHFNWNPRKPTVIFTVGENPSREILDRSIKARKFEFVLNISNADRLPQCKPLPPLEVAVLWKFGAWLLRSKLANLSEGHFICSKLNLKDAAGELLLP
jgi:hypothetical protein